jgi:NADH-quinone oxidoreductase subunit J
VGGILILLIFGVMLTNKITNVQIKTGTMQMLPAAIGVGLFSGLLLSIIINTNWKVIPTVVPLQNVGTIGTIMLSEYVVIFELLGIILLIALLGAASIARR